MCGYLSVRILFSQEETKFLSINHPGPYLKKTNWEQNHHIYCQVNFWLHPTLHFSPLSHWFLLQFPYGDQSHCFSAPVCLLLLCTVYSWESQSDFSVHIKSKWNNIKRNIKGEQKFMYKVWKKKLTQEVKFYTPFNSRTLSKLYMNVKTYTNI